MKKFVLLATCLFFALSLTAVGVAQKKDKKDTKKKTETVKTDKKETKTADKTVYVMDSGKAYHKKNCKMVKTGKKGMGLEEAKKAGYEPCKICKP